MLRFSYLRSSWLLGVMACTGPEPVLERMVQPAIEAPAPVVEVSPEPSQPVVEELALAQTQMPADLPKAARLLAAWRLQDALGEHTIVLAEHRIAGRSPGRTTTLFARDSLRSGDQERELWRLRVGGKPCPYHDVTGFVGALAVTDLDADAVAEISLTTSEGCLTHRAPPTLVRHIAVAEQLRTLRGAAMADGLAADVVWDPPRARWPEPLALAAEASLAEVAVVHAKTATGELPPTLPGELLAPAQTIRFETREISRERGVVVAISWPHLRLSPTWLAAELEAELKSFVGANDFSYPTNLVGSHEADCDVGLATSQLVSVTCRRLVDTRTRREQSEGVGGAPFGPTYARWNVWLFPGLPPLDPLDLLGDDASLGACAPLLAQGRWFLDDEGLQWDTRAVEEHLTPPECEHEPTIAWADMKPRIPRARRLIDEVTGLTP